MSPWLSVVGIGEDGVAGISPAGRALIDTAQVLAGGARHLALVPDHAGERLEWTSPFAANIAALAERRGRRVCVLASGDPMWFGMGSTLTRHFDPAEMVVVPHPGAFSLAAARLRWPLADVATLTVHGRPVAALALALAPGRRLLILSADAASPAQVAALLAGHGYGPSPMTVLERLGGPSERIGTALAESWPADAGDPLNIVAVECRLAAGARPLAATPGLPDDSFIHDGQLTKREVRAVTLAALGPWPGALLWDVGAGCGSIAIEWMRAGGRAVAIESEAGRVAMIAHNAARLGVPRLEIVTGAAPAALAGLEGTPDAIFIGGGISSPGLIEACWRALAPGGRLVANVVTAEGEAALLAWQAGHGGDLTRLAVSRLGATGRYHGWRPLMPVTQYSGTRT